VSVSRQMVRWANGLDYARLPPEVVHEAKRALVDTIGCGIGGYECEARAIAQRVLLRIGGVEEATIFGNGARAPCLSAAVVNGIMVRYLDYNDVYVVPVRNMVAGGHSSEVIPGALALAERNRVNGRDFLASVVVGYELSARMLHACNQTPFANHGWNTDSRGAVVMPIVAGKLLGLSEDQAVNAVGISASTGMILGILDTDEEANTLAKNFRFPSATHRALMAAFLAEEGFTGPERVLEGQRGFVEAVFQGDYRLDVLSAKDQPFYLLGNRYKAFAAESTAHGHLSCTLQLVTEHDLEPAQIESVRVRAGTRAVAHTGDAAKRHPTDKETADHSSWYLTAMAIMERELGPRQYSRAKYADPAVEALMSRITLEAAKEFDAYPMGGEVEIRTRDGRTLSHRVLHPKGTRENPLSDADLELKFRDMASMHMNDTRIDCLLEQLWTIDRLPDMATLLPLLVFDSGKS
jgi:2-methylcitrate dehydratase